MTFAVNTVLEGEKMGDKIMEGNRVFPTMRSGANNDRLVPVWAAGATTLPEAAEVRVSGKILKDMTPVNDVVAATITEVYSKLDQIQNQEHDGGPHDDDGINPADVAASAQHERERTRA
jgi:hypothetical protein